MGDLTKQRLLLGEKGEELALRYLQSKGYQILERNFRCRLGEIDLIALDRDCLVFVEVRTRTNARYGLPLETITETKKRKIRRTAQYFLSGGKYQDLYARFDVVAVDFVGGMHLNHIQDAFY